MKEAMRRQTKKESYRWMVPYQEEVWTKTMTSKERMRSSSRASHEEEVVDEWTSQ